MALYYPFLGCGTTLGQVVTPLVYDESLSIAQQVACLYGRLDGIDKTYLPLAEFQEFLKRLNAEQDEQTEELKDYADAGVSKLDASLRELIASIQIGMMVWDVTLGRYNANVEAMRNLFNDVTVHAVTVDTLANLDMDVDGLAECGLNVRGLAVFSGYLMGEGFTPEGIMYKGADVDIPLTTEILANGMVRDGYFVMGKEIDDGE